MSNLDYFRFSMDHEEEMFDPNYHLIVDRLVIPKTADETNELVNSNSAVIRYIGAIQTLVEDLNHSVDDEEVESILKLIIKELKTKGMNYSAFCQYFNVHNMNYSIFGQLTDEEKMKVLKHIIVHYISDRHKMYLAHGYSNIVLQVMSDNYSHKRKGTYGTNKITDMLKAVKIPNLMNMPSKSFNQNKYFLLSDKDGKTLYKKFAKERGIRIADEGKETEKYPDALIKIGKNFFIVEQKNMKENGGGQDKQAREIIDFVWKEPEFSGLHYTTYVDGIYFNQIREDAAAKTGTQYDDIMSALRNYPQNYFVNSWGFQKLIEDSLKAI